MIDSIGDDMVGRHILMMTLKKYNVNTEAIQVERGCEERCGNNPQ